MHHHIIVICIFHLHNDLVEAKCCISSDLPDLIRLSRTFDAAFALSRRDLQVNINIYT